MSDMAYSPRQRMLAALDLQQPDRVPVWELAFNESSIINIARNFTDKVPELKQISKMTLDERIMLFEALCTLVEELDLDGITVMAAGEIEHVEEALIRDRWGVISRLSDHGSPYPVDGPVKSASDLKNLKIHKPRPADLALLNLVAQKFKGERALVFHTPATFKFSWCLRGAMENLLMDYAVNPQLAHDLARITTDYFLEVVPMAIDAGADVVGIEGDLAFNTNTLMSPEQYREFIYPYHKEIVDSVHDKGAKVFKHSDGNLWPILDMLIECGFDGIHPIQPQCMELKEVKEHCHKRACVLGNIDCMYLLPFGTEQEVEQAVKQAIEDAAPRGGYIISSSNSIHPGCKAENYIAMVKAARKYGDYPISLD